MSSKPDSATASPSLDTATRCESESSGRQPDLYVSLRNIRIAGWHDENGGWSYCLSRRYRDSEGNPSYSELTLFEGDLLNAAEVCTRMAEHLMQVAVNES